jgi:hypothetical protein
MGRRILPLLAVILMFLSPAPLLVSAQGDEGSITLPPWRRPLPEGRDTATIIVGETPLEVQIAWPGHQQTLGLGYRNALEPGTGMLFPGDAPRPRTFWMKGMRFDLDIIWIRNDEIVGAAEYAKPDPEGTADMDRARYPSGEPVTHVLEVPAGWLDAHGYGPGTPVDLSDVPGL